VLGNAGNDTIINYGTIQLHVWGNEGNDNIINYGSVHGDINGDEGDDYVYISGPVGGLISGGSGYDTLEFSASTCYEAPDASEFIGNFLSIRGLSPAADTVTFGGYEYTWVEFEALISQLWL